jgi:hypothetical protein
MINIDTRLLADLEPNEMWLLLHIVKRLNDHKTAFPSKKVLLEDTRWKSEKTLKAAMDSLVEKGMLNVTHRARPDGSQTSNLYTVKTNLIGVFVTADRLQNQVKNTGGGGQKIHPPRGKKIQGVGSKKDTPNEVLYNEVLTNEVLTTQEDIAANEFADAITDIYENGEPEPVIITVEQPADPTPPKFRAAPPKTDKAPNLVYQLFEAYAKFYEGKGVPMSRNKSGSYYMPTKDANHVNLWMTWAKGMPNASGDLLADWTAYLEAAWQYGDKFIRGNFTPAVLYTQATKIVAAVNRQRMQQIELERALQASDINDLLNP